MSDPATEHATNVPPDVAPGTDTALDTVAQSRLDHLYWNTVTPVRRIAEQFDLPPRSVNALVSAMPAGFRCYRCRTEFQFASRGARADSVTRRSPRLVTCSTCGDRRRSPSPAMLDHQLTDDRVVIAVTGRHQLEIDDCVEALARIGKGWDERSLIMLLGGSEAAALGAALATYPPGTLAIPSLRDLGASQADRLQTLWAITRYGWRVITANDIQVSHSVTKWDLEHAHDDRWERTRWHHEANMPIDDPLLDRLLEETGTFTANVVYLEHRRTSLN